MYFEALAPAQRNALKRKAGTGGVDRPPSYSCQHLESVHAALIEANRANASKPKADEVKALRRGNERREGEKVI